ncbi:MAG: hypothetical protein IIA40_05155 [SAR324 cluster bacterium]|nr:hypothetical protein [SAR324 cluster bacterium]
MLDIDYSLVPMTEADHELVRDEVVRRVRAGEVPAPDRSLNGRIVVLNPDPVQTVHQISDDLRPRLRRILLPAQNGSTHLTAEHLFKAISESEERLYVLIIELQSEFRSLAAFLDYVPRLRLDFPELAVYLSGNLQNLREKLRQVLTDKSATLVLDFPEGAGRVEIDDPEEFARQVTTQEQEIAFSTPFFTEIRLVLKEGAKAIPFNLITLRKLHPIFGHGKAEEVEVGKGRKERMIIVDLPLQYIREFRFRQQRGLDFLGIVINGRTILSRHFGDEKLEFRWVPLGAVERFLRRDPGGKQEEILMGQVRALRVNTLTGQVSFLKKELADRIALENSRSVAVRKRTPSRRQRDAGDGDGEGQLITFERIVHPSSHSAHLDPMQEAVREHFYHKLIGEGVEQARKVEIYAQRLRVAGVGPLAGQTLKLLRRFGLERLIDAESFHYLCDTPEEVPSFQNTPARYEAHFASLIEAIRAIAIHKAGDAVRLNDVAYKMPICTEWVDTGLASLEKVTNHELETVYHELHLLQNFIAHEFRRNFDLQQEDLTFFQKMRDCGEAGLIAKWLSEYKRGAYGKPMPAGSYPDVLFFGTNEDKKTNDTRYYFPSIACIELFSEPLNKALFGQFDYEFSIFLEEQMALAVHQAREEGVLQPGPNEFATYFHAKIEETRNERNELNKTLEAIDDEGSPIYQQMYKQEEQAYHERYREFQADREQVEQNLAATSDQVQRLVGELKPQLDRGESAEQAFFTDDPKHPERFEQRLLEAADRSRNRLKGKLRSTFTALTGKIEERRKTLVQFAEGLKGLQQFHQAWQQAQDTRQTAELASLWNEKMGPRHEALQRMKALEREHHTRRVEAQLRNYQGEIQQIDNRMAQQAQINQRTAATLRTYVENVGVRLDKLRQSEGDADADKLISRSETLCKQMGDISRNAQILAGRVRELLEALERIRVRKQRHVSQMFQLQVEDAILKAIESKSQPAPPALQRQGEPPDETEIAGLKQAWTAQSTLVETARSALVSQGEEVEEALRGVKGQAATLHRFQEQHEELIRLIARKKRLRDSAQGLAERQQLMEKESLDLPQRVREKFMPARKQLLIEMFIPENERKASNYHKAQGFVTELLSLSHEKLKETYLDRAIYRRFYCRQFLRGAAYAADPASSVQHTLRNIPSALRLLLKALTHNFTRHRIQGAERLKLPQISYRPPKEIVASIEKMARMAGAGQFDYLVLPPTLSLEEGLALMNRKDALFNGVPRLPLIFITKFDATVLKRNTALRDAYFKALKHNVVLNVDGRIVVDNPRAIGMRLLRETLGCAIDMPNVEAPPEVVSIDAS